MGTIKVELARRAGFFRNDKQKKMANELAVMETRRAVAPVSSKTRGKRMFSYSLNGELYTGRFETKEEAAYEAKNAIEESGLEQETFTVGEADSPVAPESFWDAEQWIEHVACQDDYSHDAADDWDESTKEQREELEAKVRPILAEWLDRHKLRPTFAVIRDYINYEIIDGVPVEKKAEVLRTWGGVMDMVPKEGE